MRFDVDELSADELEAGAYEVYEAQSRRNQYPQPQDGQAGQTEVGSTVEKARSGADAGSDGEVRKSAHERSEADKKKAQEGDLPDGESYESVVSDIADYTMISPPNAREGEEEVVVASMSES